MNVNELSYKDYLGTVEWSEEDNVFHGRVLGIQAHIFYEGKDINDLRKDFIDAVESYLDYCYSKNLKPEKPYKGSFNVRVDPKLHSKAVEKAKEKGVSLNKLVTEALQAYLL